MREVYRSKVRLPTTGSRYVRIVSTQSQITPQPSYEPAAQPSNESAALDSLFAPGVVVAVRREPGHPADLMPAEAVSVQKAVPKRVNEFAAGRTCARQALAAFGQGAVAIPQAADRQPVWPSGFVGSITHTAGFCAAAVAHRNKFSALGLDSERSGAPTRDIWSTLCRSEELHWVASLPLDQQPAAVTLLFSAKEAVYKCQYPLTGEWLDFHDLRIEVADWGQQLGRFEVTPTRRLKIADQGALPSGRYVFHEDFVSTALGIAAGA